MVQSTSGSPANRDVSAPDAVGRGVLGHDPKAADHLFVLAGHSLGSTPVGGDATPRWLDLRRLLNLDAVGEPSDSKVPIEANFDGEATLEAIWPEQFCEQVVDRLRELLDNGEMIPEGSDEESGSVETAGAQAAEASPFGVQRQSESPAFSAPADDHDPISNPTSSAAGSGASRVLSDADAPLWAVQDDRPLPGDGPPLAGAVEGQQRGELTLEDVVYHGGYPGETKRRKKCVAVLDGRGLTVSGPNGPEFSLPWESVRSVEAQNTDEAKFRLGVKAKRNSTVVVFECDQDVAIVLEAQDVPTLPLKAALHELLDGGPVAVA